MKKLSEIKLNDFYEMDEMEMRSIIGGSGSGDDGSGSGSGGSGSGTKCLLMCGPTEKDWGYVPSCDNITCGPSGAGSVVSCRCGY